MSDEPIYRVYRCFMRSVPGMYEQYEGHVDVHSPSDDWDEVFSRATAQLRRTSFPDRSTDCWRMDDFQLHRSAQ